jgi:hypothetical protein
VGIKVGTAEGITVGEDDGNHEGWIENSTDETADRLMKE